MSPSARWTTPPTVMFVALAVALLAACGGSSGGSSTSSEPETIEVPTRWASGTAATLPSLVQTSDEVFFGRVTRVIGQQETEAGSGGRGTLPLTSFEVTVGSALAGGLVPGATVIIEQVGGTTEISGGAQANIILDGDQRLAAGAEYLFFADRKPNGNLTSPPFGRLQVGADGTLSALPRWSNLGALQQLSGLSVSAAVARVGAPQ